jgi:hypothetical protein
MNQTSQTGEEHAQLLFEQALKKREQLWDLLEEIESALDLPRDSIQLSDICEVPSWEGFALPTLSDLLQVRKERLAQEAEEEEGLRDAGNSEGGRCRQKRGNPSNATAAARLL